MDPVMTRDQAASLLAQGVFGNLGDLVTREVEEIELQSGYRPDQSTALIQVIGQVMYGERAVEAEPEDCPLCSHDHGWHDADCYFVSERLVMA